MARSTIEDVARVAGLSVSTVNRVIHEPAKVREVTLKTVLQAAEDIGFYGLGSIRESLRSTRPKVRIGVLLLQSNRSLYRNYNAALVQAAQEVRDHEVVIRVEHIEVLTPQNVSQGLERMAASSDVVGVVSTEHPVVAVSIENLAAKGVRTFALLSELNAKCNVGYIGMDNWKVGRTAGWALANICKSGGKVGILVGNHRYRCQETSDSGFRSYFREHPCELEVLEARSTFETSSIAQEQVEQMLEQHADLSGIYVAGGGISGACAALRTSGRAKSVALVGHELTETTRAALLDGTINLLLSHPMQHLAQQTIAAMIRCHDAGPDYPPESISLPFEVITPENL